MLLEGFRVRDDNSGVRIWKIKNARSNMALAYSKFNNFFFFLTTIRRKTITRGFLRPLKMVVNSDFEITNPIWRPCIRFLVKIRRFSLIRNLNSTNKNSILRSHTWRFDKIHVILYLFVWKIHKGFFTSFLSYIISLTIRGKTYWHILFR